MDRLLKKFADLANAIDQTRQSIAANTVDLTETARALKKEDEATMGLLSTFFAKRTVDAEPTITLVGPADDFQIIAQSLAAMEHETSGAVTACREAHRDGWAAHALTVCRSIDPDRFPKSPNVKIFTGPVPEDKALGFASVIFTKKEFVAIRYATHIVGLMADGDTGMAAGSVAALHAVYFASSLQETIPMLRERITQAVRTLSGPESALDDDPSPAP